MDKKTAITKYAEIVSRLQGQNVATLRKSAQGKITNVKGMRKDALVHALADWEAKQDGIDVRLLDETAGKAKKSVNAIAADAPKGGTSVNAIAAETADDAKKATAKKTGRKMCAVCEQRPVDRKTQGRDSTMCGPCYEYAGEENRHIDQQHEENKRLLEAGEFENEPLTIAGITDEIAGCPVCQGQDPAKRPIQRRKSKAGEVKIKGDKPKAFAEAAKEAGYRVKVQDLGDGKVQVIATSREDSVSLVWDNNRYVYDESAHTDAKGNSRKVRNASAAKKIMAG